VNGWAETDWALVRRIGLAPISFGSVVPIEWFEGLAVFPVIGIYDDVEIVRMGIPVAHDPLRQGHGADVVVTGQLANVL